MSKKSNEAGLRGSTLALLRGGKTVPEALLHRHAAEVKRDLPEWFKEKSALQQQAAKYRSKIQKPVAEDARAMAGLREISDRLAKRKLVVPAMAREIPGILAGTYSLRVTPPYDYAYAFTLEGIVYPDGNPDFAASADNNTGQMSCSVVTDSEAPSDGSAYAEQQIFFVPLFEPAILRVRANLAITYSWWVNSLGPEAISEAQGLIHIWGFKQNGGSVIASDISSRGAFLGWAETAENELKFDFGTYPSPQWFVELAVDRSHFYVVTVSVLCRALGVGWPGNLAGATVSMTVPSVTLDVQLTPEAVGG